jgi:hypothetical protein
VRIAVLGDAAGNSLLERLGFEVRANDRPQSGEPVLIAVSGRDGPLCGFVEALNRATGTEAGHIGLLLTEVSEESDEELIALTEHEVRYLLDGVGVLPWQVAHRLPCFRTDDPELQGKWAAWAATPPAPLRFMHGELLPDW